MSLLDSRLNEQDKNPIAEKKQSIKRKKSVVSDKKEETIKLKENIESSVLAEKEKTKEAKNKIDQESAKKIIQETEKEKLKEKLSIEDEKDDHEKHSKSSSSSKVRDLKSMSVSDPSKSIEFKNADEAKAFLGIVIDIHKRLINDPNFDNAKLDLDNPKPEEIKKIKREIEKEVITLVNLDDELRLRKNEMDALIQSVINETIGLGPIEDLITDESVSEMMINGPDTVYVEKDGQLERVKTVFFDEEHLRRIIVRIVNKIGRRIDESMPLVDARLLDGSRVNAVIPPIAMCGSTLTIRKFAKTPLDANALVRLGAMTPEICKFLEILVLALMNIMVAGGTGSGKTTTLNVLSSFIPKDERIVTIEDSAELQLKQDHVITLETRPPNSEGQGEVTMRDLVKNDLRMRPDRLIVGEVRGGETLDMLQAMNTGHDGSMTTAHSNTPRDMMSRVETMVLMSGLNLPVKAVRSQAASAFNFIIQQSRMQDGSRKITQITEVCGMEEETVVLNDIFLFKQTGINRKTGKVEGFFTATGTRPQVADKIESMGHEFPNNLFKANPKLKEQK